MDLDLPRFVIGRAAALGEGLDDERANQLGLVVSLMTDNLMLSYILVRELARREVPPPPETPVSEPPGDTQCCEAAMTIANDANTTANDVKATINLLVPRVEGLEKRIGALAP